MKIKIRCARCGNKYQLEQPWHYLCGDCWQECGLFGDEESIRFWKIGSTFANGTWTDEEWKEFSDCAVGQEMLHELLDQMDVTMKLRLIRQELEKFG